MGLADTERAAIADLLESAGPDAPTLCEGWTTRDLAAHLVLRERRPDAALGILITPLAGYTARTQGRIADRPWPELIGMVRQGPASWSPYSLPALKDRLNGLEFFVHHEDIRRGRPGWRPRPADPERDRVVWRALGSMGRLLYRRSPVGITVRTPDGQEQVIKVGTHPVVLAGAPGEVLLHAFGRDAAEVDVQGAPEDVAAFAGAARGV
jgi:uncharacterized protein (TIGR03085 family)